MGEDGKLHINDVEGRNLKTGEYQRQDGRFEYRYTDPGTGKKNAVYETDLKKLRELEKDVQRDIDDGIAMSPILRSMTVNELFQRYLMTRELAESTRHNYEYLWNPHKTVI
ncbi:MAG: integrase DNA-binding domain-containing protein [Lachnospiraceae bacterium]|nr:integrase DNA-binding domain-containing protein [Lachnospiraceae bacterium]